MPPRLADPPPLAVAASEVAAEPLLLPLRVALPLPHPLPLPATEKEALPLALPLPLLWGEAEALLQPESLAVPLRLSGVGVPPMLEELQAVVCGEAVARDETVGAPLPQEVAEAQAVAQVDAVLCALGVAVCEGLEGLAAALCVALLLCSPLAVRVGLAVGEPEEAAVVVSPAAVALAQALPPPLGLASPLPLATALGAEEALGEAEGAAEGLLAPEELPLTEGGGLAVPTEAEGELQSCGDAVGVAVCGLLGVALCVPRMMEAEGVELVLGEPVGSSGEWVGGGLSLPAAVPVALPWRCRSE